LAFPPRSKALSNQNTFNKQLIRYRLLAHEILTSVKVATQLKHIVPDYVNAQNGHYEVDADGKLVMMEISNNAVRNFSRGGREMPRQNAVP